jgi:hypothetical protein
MAWEQNLLPTTWPKVATSTPPEMHHTKNLTIFVSRFSVCVFQYHRTGDRDVTIHTHKDENVPSESDYSFYGDHNCHRWNRMTFQQATVWCRNCSVQLVVQLNHSSCYISCASTADERRSRDAGPHSMDTPCTQVDVEVREWERWRRAQISTEWKMLSKNCQGLAITDSQCRTLSQPASCLLLCPWRQRRTRNGH